MDVLGIGIGGSGIKGAPVDLKTGDLLEERIRIPTTQAPTSVAVVETSLDLIGRFGRDGPVRMGFPGVIKGSMCTPQRPSARSLAASTCWSGCSGRSGIPCVSKKAGKFVPKLRTRAKIVPAQMMNIAGIAGAALAPEAFPRSAPRVAALG